MNKEFNNFVAEFESNITHLYKEANLAYFNASISGNKDDYKRSAELQIELNKIFSDKKNFLKLKEFKDSKTVQDEIEKRLLDVLFNAFLSKQIDDKKLEAIVNLQTKIENTFSTFRVEVDGKQLTDNQVDEILLTSNDSKDLEKVWTASKVIGKVVSEDVLKLVNMRNESAKELGFNNYHQMSLLLSEQKPEEIEILFNTLDDLTRETYTQLKNEIDDHLSNKLSISKDNLMPWHYQNKFFQEPPKIYSVDLDKYYKEQNLEELTKKYFTSIGLLIDDLVEQSDLYEKPGKYQHAYCIHLDRSGDVRVVCNLKPNYRWMSTSLHEFGHAVYDKLINRNLPWALREPSHIFTTEAIAMMFGRMASNKDWLKDVVGINDQEAESISEDSFNVLRLEQLVFSRWSQVMYRFEKEMYEHPEQDLNQLWWKLVEKYQMIKKPENRNAPDWASKIHIALYPAYYHNYLMGELFASQLNNFINQNILQIKNISSSSFFNISEVGNYLKEKVFHNGALYHWSQMINMATGEPLTPIYYANQFVKR